VNRHQTRRGLAVGIALAVAAGLGACSPITTKLQYAASDGVRVEVGDAVTVQNLMIVAAAQGEPGAVQGAVVNNGGEDATVTIGSLTVTAPAGETVLLGGAEGEELVVDSVPAAPGATAQLPVGLAGAEGETVYVPVLDGTLPEYADLVPADA
jgi:hypothetical protein